MKADAELQVVSRVRETVQSHASAPRAPPIAIDEAADGSLAIEGEVATVAEMSGFVREPAVRPAPGPGIEFGGQGWTSALRLKYEAFKSTDCRMDRK